MIRTLLCRLKSATPPLLEPSKTVANERFPYHERVREARSFLHQRGIHDVKPVIRSNA